MEFAEFYESSRDDCLRIVLLHVGDRQLAEELVAEGFARAWVSWRKVRVHPEHPRDLVATAPPRGRPGRPRRCGSPRPRTRRSAPIS
jgi:hypothetical protein